MKEVKTNYFTNGFVTALKLEDNHLIETTSTCLPLETEIRLTGKKDNIADINKFSVSNWKEKWMVGISTQSGCPIKCKFCAVNRLTEAQGWRNLTADEMVDQVYWAVKKAQRINGNINPNNAKLFRILFTRMGEPSLNIDNVIDAIKRLKEMFPKARIQISTIGLKKSKELVRHLIELDSLYGANWLELQFSIHSTDNEFRKWLQCDQVLTNSEINDICKEWVSSSVRAWKATLNFALAETTPFNVEDLKNQFDTSNVFIKISPINENVVSDDNQLKTRFTYKNTI